MSPLSSEQLLELCRTYLQAPQSEAGWHCSSYIRGFIEGSADIVLLTGEPKDSRAESFSDRAWRTRLGIRPPAPPEYCIDASIFMRDFIAQMLEHARQVQLEPDDGASILLFGTLSRFHRCAR